MIDLFSEFRSVLIPEKLPGILYFKPIPYAPDRLDVLGL